MPRAAAQDFGFAPGYGFGEIFAVDEFFEGFFGFPLAEDDVAAFGLDVLVHVTFDVTGEGFDEVEDAEEAFFEFCFFAGDDVVMHADGCHGGPLLVVSCEL